MNSIPSFSKNLVASLTLTGALIALSGCQTPNPAPDACKTVCVTEPSKSVQAAKPAVAAPATSGNATTNKPIPKRFTYTAKVYPVDERGFSPVGKALEKAYAREEMITDDEEGALNPYVLKVI